MKKLTFFILLMVTANAKAQVISQFTFSSTPLTTAAVGPNGTSVSSSATSGAVPAPVNYAINPGTPKADVNLVVPGSPTFDVPGIDIDLYFRREESDASFFKRGSLFNFGMTGGNLNVTFTTNKGSNPGTTTVSSGTIAAIANDHAFHHYRFKYDNNTGVANVYVDNVVVYTYTGTSGYTLNWTSAGNVTIGDQMDATGLNIPVLGNVIISMPAPAMLPVSLLSFDAAVKNNTAVLNWTSTKESNFDHYVVESSTDGVRFQAFDSVAGTSSYDLVHRYSLTDHQRHEGVVCYRLKMVDIDGRFSYSPVKKLSFSIFPVSTCYPNPASDHVVLSLSSSEAGDFKYFVISATGSILQAAVIHIGSGAQQITIAFSSNIPKGIVMVQLVNTQSNRSESFKIAKS